MVSAGHRTYDPEAMEASESKPAVASTPPQAARPQQKPAEDDVERYTVEGWRERARQLGNVSVHAIAGAFHGVDEGERLTEAEVRDRLDHFHRREAVERPQESS